MAKERVLRYDIVRITAICMVLMIHASTAMVIFTQDTFSRHFLVGSVFNGIGRAGVPMFFMLSGALLLDENRLLQPRKFYKKKLLPIVLMLAFWLLFYATWRTFLLPVLAGSKIDRSGFLKYIMRLTGLYPHLWYLFAIIGLYLAVPVLRLFVKKENRSYILGMILVGVVVQYVGTSASFFTRNTNYKVGEFISKFHFDYAYGYLTYFLIGWYLTTFDIKKEIRKILYILSVGACILSILVLILYADSEPNITDYVMEAYTFPAMMYGVGVFLWINTYFANKTTTKKWVCELSNASFGVYVIHVLFLDILTETCFRITQFWTSFPLMYLILLTLACGFCSLVVVLLCSKLKGIKKLFHY